jgi:hypothetical protein
MIYLSTHFGIPLGELCSYTFEAASIPEALSLMLVRSIISLGCSARQHTSVSQTRSMLCCWYWTSNHLFVCSMFSIWTFTSSIFKYLKCYKVLHYSGENPWRVRTLARVFYSSPAARTHWWCCTRLSMDATLRRFTRRRDNFPISLHSFGRHKDSLRELHNPRPSLEGLGSPLIVNVVTNTRLLRTIKSLPGKGQCLVDHISGAARRCPRHLTANRPGGPRGTAWWLAL